MLKNDLGNDKILPLVLKLAIPSMLAQFVNVLYTIVDRFFVSHIPEIGELCLASVGIVSPITTFISAFAYLVGLGGAPLFAIKMGEGNNKTAERILFNCVFALFMVGVVLMGVSYGLKDYLLRWFGASDNTFGYANEYMTYYLIGTIFAIGSMGINSFITAQGFSGTSMFFIVVGAVTNIILDYVFIFVAHMGVRGAAVATVIAQVLSCSLMVIFLLSKKSKIRLKVQRLDGKIIRKVMATGFGPFFINSTDSLLVVMINVLMQKYGGVDFGDIYISATTISLSAYQLMAYPLNGITLGCQPIVSYNYGSQNIKRVKKAMFVVTMVCIVYCTIMTIAMQCGTHVFVSLFTNDDAVSSVAIRWVKIYTAGVLCLGIQYPSVDMMVAMGLALPGAMLSLNRKLAIAILILTLPLGFGAEGAIMAEPIGDAYCMIVSLIVFLIVSKKALEKREHEVVVKED